ncbi:MAG: hypothetical protein EOO73_20795 [Myxococcales bacterium]|nr:MAG: hypothetical protein EOO73_20795 [Myxococcales bacterium]
MTQLRFAILCPLLSILATASCGSPTEGDGLGGSPAGGSPPIAGGAAGGAGGGISAGGTSPGGSAAGGAGGSGGSSGSVGSAGAAGTSAGGAAGSGGGGGANAAGSSTGGVAGANAGGTGGSGGTGSGEPVFHLFMLMGQSNMVGVAKAEASDKNTDERLKVWGGCNQKAGQWNTATPPLSDCPGGSGINLSTSVDPGIWFAKTLLKKLPPGDTIGLIGTAESGEKIETFITGGKYHQAIMNKIAAVKTAKNARFEGVIFHQGESNNNQGTWPALVKQLYSEVKAGFGVSYDVPFILGELPAGGCCSIHNALVHQAAMQLPMGSYVSQDGTKVMDEYHFDHASVILMGTRYGDKMLEALKW